MAGGRRTAPVGVPETEWEPGPQRGRPRGAHALLRPSGRTLPCARPDGMASRRPRAGTCHTACTRARSKLRWSSDSIAHRQVTDVASDSLMPRLYPFPRAGTSVAT